jgi:hypothetical protein
VKKLLLLALLMPALVLAISDTLWFDVNHWKVLLGNDGRWGYNPQGSGSAAGSWPQPLQNYYVFGAGAWVGAIMDSVSPETLTTVFYNPNFGGTEGYPTLCRYWRDSVDSLDRIYVYPGDWPPPLSRFPTAPQIPRSDRDMWCCFCDSNPENHISPGRPLGIDVYLTVFGYDDSLARDFFFLKYELCNSSGDSIHDAYFGAVLDADIGYGSDDMTSLILDHTYEVDQETIRVQNTGFAYDYDNYEATGSSWESGTPGVVAVTLLDSPESLGLTAFKKFTVDIDPVTDAPQYLTLAGYDYRTGVYQPYDSVDLAQGDKRMLLATGPFDLAPDSVLTFWYAVIGSPFGDSAQPPAERDTSELALRYKWARYYFDQVTGLAEKTPTAERRVPNSGPTITRGVLLLPRDMTDAGHDPNARHLGSCPKSIPRPVLLDISGRKVLDLHPGANDIRVLSPGVYFVRMANGVGRTANSKVVVTR